MTVALGVAVLLLAAGTLCKAQPQPPLVCPEATGFGLCAEFCSADTPCPDGQLCCSNGCGHSCMAGVPPAVNCSDPEQEGVQFNPTPCEFCTCEQGDKICAVVDCAYPDCDGGLMPVVFPGDCCPRCPHTTCPDTTGMVGTCVEGCSDDSVCGNGQLCCSNGCGHVCTAPYVNCSGVPDGYTHQPTPCETCICSGGERRCDMIFCDWPVCPNGVIPVTAPGECCPGCPASSCTEGGNSYASGMSWTCSDGCNTCSCRNGTVLSTLIACPPLRPCTDATGVHPSGDSWTCPDGCNTCTCFNGTVGSTRIACAPCTDGDTNAVHQSGESWRCRDGCPTCTCRHGSVVVNATGCPSNCTNEDGDIMPEGSYWQLNNDPCTTCFCREGQEACLAIACALPYCGPGVQPVSVPGQCCPGCPTPQRPPHITCPDLSNLTTTCDLGCASDQACEGTQICCPGGCSSVCVDPVLLTCPDASGKIGTCVESCNNSSQCQIGQLCCSNGCGHECVIADELNCSLVECPAVRCSYGTPFTPEGECCPQCPVDCRTVLCAQPDCADYEEEVIPRGGCCPVCRCKPSLCPIPLCLHGPPFTPEGECCQECPANCSAVRCAYPECESYEQAVIPEGQCCHQCQCNRTLCPVLRCEGTPFTPKGDCCPRCPREPPLVCPGPTGFGLCVESCSADTPCPDGQLCCSNGCGHSCMAGVPPAANCSDPEQEGVQFNPTPCMFCTCEQRDKICAVVDCAYPDCDGGLMPVVFPGDCCPRCPHTTCPDTTGMVGTCVEGCSDDSVCGNGQLCCSNGCGHVCTAPYVNCSGVPDGYTHQPTPCETCTCSGGERRCDMIFCDWPVCPNGVSPVTTPGECCPGCPTSSCTEGGNSYASGMSWTCSDGCNTCFCVNGDVTRTEIACPPSCAAVSCLEVNCREGQGTVVPSGECCPTCQDCSTVSCNVSECDANEQRVYRDTQCCPECQDCRLVDCADVDCEYGRPFTPKGECCLRCPPEEKLCEEYGEELDVTDMDPCLECECNAEFVYECRRVTSGEDCEAVSCQLDDMLYRPGSIFTDGCSRCECTNGVVKCAEMGCSAVDGSGVRLEMGFAGNYDDYNDVAEQEELIKVLKKQLSSKFRHLSFKDSQVKDVTVHQGSVYLTFTIVAVEGGADPGTVAKTLETEHRSGALVLVANNQTLVPLASTFSLTYVAAGSDMQDVAPIVVPVVVGVVVIVAIAAATIVILYAMKTARGQSASGKANYRDGVCTIQNEYMAVDEKVKWDSSSIDSDKEVKV